MKKAILIVASLLAITTTKAQEGPVPARFQKDQSNKKTPAQRAQQSVDSLNAEVTLTEDQKSKIYDLALTKAKKVEEIRAKYKGQPENKEIAKKEIDVVKNEYHQNMKAILTKEQLAKMRAEHKEAKAAKQSK